MLLNIITKNKLILYAFEYKFKFLYSRYFEYCYG